MISFSSAMSFAFGKRSFIIGSILLFITLLLMFCLGYPLFVNSEYFEVLNKISSDQWQKIKYVLYAIKTFFYAFLFTYFLILAKRLVYNQSTRFSGEFFAKVLTVSFLLPVVFDIILYATYFPILNWSKFKKALTGGSQIIQEISKTFGMMSVMMLFVYVMMAIYMAYAMHFNFSDFIYKLKRTFSSVLTLLKIIGMIVLFLVLCILPFVAFYYVINGSTFWFKFGLCHGLASYSLHVVKAIHRFLISMSCLRSLISEVFFYIVLVEIPMIVFCIATVRGRIVGICLTAFYLASYGLLRLLGMPLWQVSTMIYLYFCFFFYGFLFIIFTVICPSFFVHLLAQGALEINRKFNPLAGTSEKEKIPLGNAEIMNTNMNYTSETHTEQTYTTSSNIDEPEINTVSTNNNFDIEFDRICKKRIFMKRLILFVMVLIIGSCVGLYIKGHKPNFVERVYKNSDIKVKYLDGEALSFFQKYYPSTDKRLVLYYPNPQNSKLPIIESYTGVLTAAMNSRQWQEYYDFRPQETRGKRMSIEEAKKDSQNMVMFGNDICGLVCIVDTQEQWVFSIKRPDLFEVSLEEFKK